MEKKYSNELDHADIVSFNIEKAGCDFADWLVEHGYWEHEDAIEDTQALVDDFFAAFGVAPRLINLLANIADR